MPNQFTVYKSGDSGYPVLTGQAGSLTTALDAILVNGYGSKAAAGWQIAYTGTNKRVYRSPYGNRFYYQFLDNAPAVANEARLRAWEVMSDVDTGVSGPFPTVAQQTNGVFCRKSRTTDATERTWIAFADTRTLYFFTRTGDVANTYSGWGLGEFYSLVPNDAYCSFVCSRVTENVNDVNGFLYERLDYCYNGGSNNFFVTRNSGGTLGAIDLARFWQGDFQAAYYVLNGSLTYPNGPDGGLYMAPVWIYDTSTSMIRGRMRGFWATLHAATNFSDGQTFSGTGNLNGRTFQILRNGSFAAYHSLVSSYILETSASLETT